MTKIKIDIESDKEITQANLNIKYADGCQINKEVVNSEVPVTSSSTKTKTTSSKSNVDETKYKKGVDPSFNQVY